MIATQLWPLPYTGCPVAQPGVFVVGACTVYLERERKTIQRIGTGVLMAISLITGSFLALKEFSAIKEHHVFGRFSAISLSDPTTAARLFLWVIAVKGWEERPILGWGQENFPYIFAKHYDPGMYGRAAWVDRAHDALTKDGSRVDRAHDIFFFDWLTAGGVLGLFTYLSIFCTAIWYASVGRRYGLRRDKLVNWPPHK